MTGRGVAGSRGRCRFSGGGRGNSSSGGRTQGYRSSSSIGVRDVIRGHITTSSIGAHVNEEADYESPRAGLDGIHTTEDEENSAVHPESLLSNESRGTTLRKWIGITPDGKRFDDEGQANREVTPIVKSMYRGAWSSWGKVPVEHKNRMFERFKMKFQWDPEIEIFILGLFNALCSKRLTEELSKARNKAVASAQAAGAIFGSDFSILNPYNPPWMRQQHWITLVSELWSTVEWQKLSTINKENRKRLIGGYHTTGSVGYDVCRRRMEKTLGRELEVSESFTHSHAKKGTRPLDGAGSSSEIVYVDERSRICVEKYKGLMAEKHGPDKANHPSFDSECWEQCTGGRKKGRAYGSSTSLDPCYVLTGRPSPQSSSSSSSSYSTFRHSQVHTLTQRLAEIEEEREREREEIQAERERERAEIQEERERERTEMREREERLVRESKESAEAVRVEMNEKIAGIMKFMNYTPPSS